MSRFGNLNGRSMSEFANGLHGDCGPTASLLAVAAAFPQQFSVSAASLQSWANAQIAAGRAASNGAQNIPDMDAWLSSQGIAHTTVGYGQDTDLSQLHAQLLAFRDRNSQDPVIVEWAAAGLGLPEDEPGVQYHFSTFFWLDDSATAGDGAQGGYGRGDGDSRTDHSDGSPSDCLVTSWAEITKAQPIAFIVVHAQQAPSNGDTAVWKIQPDGSGIDDHGNRIGPGLMSAIGQGAANALSGETFAASFGLTIPGASSWVPLENDTLAIWSGTTAYVEAHGGQIAAAFARALSGALSNEGKLNDQITALNQQLTTITKPSVGQAWSTLGAALFPNDIKQS